MVFLWISAPLLALLHHHFHHESRLEQTTRCTASWLAKQTLSFFLFFQIVSSAECARSRGNDQLIGLKLFNSIAPRCQSSAAAPAAPAAGIPYSDVARFTLFIWLAYVHTSHLQSVLAAGISYSDLVLIICLTYRTHGFQYSNSDFWASLAVTLLSPSALIIC